MFSIICLLISGFIFGFVIGYNVCKRKAKKDGEADEYYRKKYGGGQPQTIRRVK